MHDNDPTDEQLTLECQQCRISPSVCSAFHPEARRLLYENLRHVPSWVFRRAAHLRGQPTEVERQPGTYVVDAEEVQRVFNRQDKLSATLMSAEDVAELEEQVQVILNRVLPKQ